ncbi:hypothetical protein [Paraglaciecola sp.]|uniref:hypothetical protein n=1 Tax=Paraglaciecola sp. TaxID=1920173 RepID=UPI0030F440E3
MSKVLLFTYCILFSCILSADEDAAPVEPLDPQYMGTHAMVLVSHASTLYASLMTQYKAPHNVQLIYKVDSKYVPLIHMVADADLVTIKPKPFNLQHLLRAEKLTLKVDVYLGHYLRGGIAIMEDIDLILDKQLYLRMLETPAPSSIRQNYDTVTLTNNLRILVHQIQSAPSYDQLILLLDNVSCMTNFTMTNAVPNPNEIYLKLAYCGSIKPLYYESQDFQK